MMDYLHKIEENTFQNVFWNIPEQKQGKVNIIGGNSQSFRASIKTAEFLAKKYPIAEINMVMPDILKASLPPLPNIIYLESTDTGSFADKEALESAMKMADYNLLIGDLSKNKITGKIIASACQNSALPLMATRDAVDLMTENGPDKILMNKNIIIMGSMAQMQKLFRAVYYPRMLTLSQSLVQVAESLHKFTLSYPISVVTLHNDQVIIAENGTINIIPLEKSGLSPMLFWDGEIAAKIVALNLYNPNNFIDATSAAIFS